MSYDLRCLIYSEGRAEVTRSLLLWYNTTALHCTFCVLLANLYDTNFCVLYIIHCVLPCVYTTELAVVLNRVPSVNLAQNDADRLNDELGLTRYGPSNDLKKIVRLSSTTQPSPTGSSTIESLSSSRPSTLES